MSRHATRIRTVLRSRFGKSRRPALRLDPLEDRTVPTAVALLGADVSDWVDDVRNKLLATGQFSSVDEVNVMVSTPTLAQLENYGSVLVWSDYGFADQTALGNTLADYVDAGHGVVVATFANTFFGPLGGRWAAGGYDPIQPGGYAAFTPLTLGPVAQPGHAIMAGVTNFSGGNASWHGTGPLNAGSSLVASWSDGLPLVAERSAMDVGLNMFPPSSDVYSDGWNSGTQGGLLMANALSYVSGFGARALSPANGDIVFTPPTDFVVGFSAAYDPATIDAADLTVNGIPATSVTQTDAATLTFQFANSPVTAQGPQSIRIADGAVASLDGDHGMRELDASFRYDAVLMQATSTTPAIGSTVLLPFTTLDLNFNEPFDPASAQMSDFAVDQGTVAAVTPVDADTLRLTLSGVVAEGTLNVSMPAGAMTDVYGNPGAAFAANYRLDFGTFPFPTPLHPQSPAGSLVYDDSQAGIIDPSGDTDGFSIQVDPGQKVTVTVDPAGTLWPTVDLYRVEDTGNTLVGTATATAAGIDAVLQTVPTTGQIGVAGPGPQNYLVVVRGSGGTTGAYTVRFLLGAGVESESHGGVTNNTPATAQSLEPSFLPFNSAVTAAPSAPYPGRGAVLGHLDAAPLTTVPGAFANQETFNANAYPFVIAPFGIPSMRYQQIYSASEFNTGGVIDRLRFRRSIFSGPFDNIDMDVQIRIGYAARSVDTASANFADNVGAGSTVVYDGPLHLSSTGNGSPNPFDVTIDVANTFNYDPSQGDLLVDFFVRSSSAPFASYFEATPFGAQDSTTRVFSFNVNDPSGNVGFFGSNTAPYGLVTQFAFVPPDRQDVYKFNLTAGESATLALKGAGATVTLQNAAGATVASGVSGAKNLDSVISDFVAPATGTYYARVVGTNVNGTDYSLVVTRNAAFDTEDNNAIAKAQNLSAPAVSGRQWALGAVEPPTGLLFTVDGDHPFSIQQIDPNTGAIIQTIPTPIQVGGGPDGLAFDGNHLWLVNSYVSDHLYEIDPATGTLVSETPLNSPGFIDGVAALAGKIYISNSSTDQILAFDPATHSVTGVMNIAADLAGGLAGITGPNALIASLSFNDIAEIDPTTGTITNVFNPGVGTVLGVATAADNIYIGGFFNGIDEFTRAGTFVKNVAYASSSITALGGDDVGGGPGADVYRVSVGDLKTLDVSTALPARQNGEFVNTLDPIVRIYNAAGRLVASDDNSDPDGRDAKVSYKVPKGAGGVYYIEVSASPLTAQPTSGDYILSVKGAAPPAGSAHALSIAPAAAKKLTASARSLLGEAERLWRQAGFNTSLLGKLDIRVADLGGGTLGLASGSTIWLDASAAGLGWFVDHTPQNDWEFTRAGNQGEQGRIDLLSVLVYEVGHLLGTVPGLDGMTINILGPGVRRKPGELVA